MTDSNRENAKQAADCCNTGACGSSDGIPTGRDRRLTLMRRAVIRLVCVVIGIGGFVFLFPLQPAGRLSSGSGVYLGDGILISNQHVLEFRDEQTVFRVPAWKYGVHAIDAPVEEPI